MSAPTESEPKSAAFPIDMLPLTDPEAIAARDRLWLERVSITASVGLVGRRGGRRGSWASW